MTQPWFARKPKLSGYTEEAPPDVSRRMVGLWVKCDNCDEIQLRDDLLRNLNVCTACDHHMQWSAPLRLAALCDDGTFKEVDAQLTSLDPLNFSDSKKYRDRVRTTRKALGHNDAFVSGVGTIDGREVEVGCFLFEFMGGSMGSVVGEKITRLFERATRRRCPAIVFSSSGGARMQEGAFSLMQMAKTCAALMKFRAVRQPYISVLLHPTTGGVAASFSWLGDVVLAEPKAQIGFAGPRVIEQTIRQKLPEGFQRSEFLIEKGMLDAIVARRDLRARISLLMQLLCT